MEVTDRKQVGLALGEPHACRCALAPRTVLVTAGVVGNPPVPAVGTGLDVPAHVGGAAGFYRRHDLELVETQVPCIGGPVRRTGRAEDVGDLDGGAHGCSAAGRSRFSGGRGKPVERAGDIAQHPGGDLRVIGGGLQFCMPQQRLDDANIDPVLKQVGGETVP